MTRGITGFLIVVLVAVAAYTIGQRMDSNALAYTTLIKKARNQRAHKP